MAGCTLPAAERAALGNKASDLECLGQYLWDDNDVVPTWTPFVSRVDAGSVAYLLRA